MAGWLATLNVHRGCSVPPCNISWCKFSFCIPSCLQVAPSVDQLSGHCIGFCKEFEVESLPSAAGAAGAAAAAVGGTEASPHANEGSDVSGLGLGGLL